MREFSFLAIKFLRWEKILRAPRNQQKKRKNQKVSSVSFHHRSVKVCVLEAHQQGAQTDSSSMMMMMVKSHRKVQE